MNANNTNKEKEGKVIYPELSYIITGILFETHNTLGRFCREKQYDDFIETKLIDRNIPYKREYVIENTGNKVDFTIDDKIIIENKVKKFLLKEDYY